MLTRTLELPVEDAFSLASIFLTNPLEETSQANTDEMFCLSLSLSSSSPHPLEIVSMYLETQRTSSLLLNAPNQQHIWDGLVRPVHS